MKLVSEKIQGPCECVWFCLFLVLFGLAWFDLISQAWKPLFQQGQGTIYNLQSVTVNIMGTIQNLNLVNQTNISFSEIIQLWALTVFDHRCNSLL